MNQGDPKTPTYWDKLKLFTPPFVRLYAADRRQGHAEEITDEQIMERSGLSLSQINRITWSENWDNITVGEMKKFLKACNADFTEPATCHHMKSMFARQAKFRHCYRSPNRKFYGKLMKFYTGEED